MMTTNIHYMMHGNVSHSRNDIQETRNAPVKNGLNYIETLGKKMKWWEANSWKIGITYYINYM